jgi:hypothetical protein
VSGSTTEAAHPKEPTTMAQNLYPTLKERGRVPVVGHQYFPAWKSWNPWIQECVESIGEPDEDGDQYIKVRTSDSAIKVVSRHLGRFCRDYAEVTLETKAIR